jgi:hypothetical protein
MMVALFLIKKVLFQMVITDTTSLFEGNIKSNTEVTLTLRCLSDLQYLVKKMSFTYTIMACIELNVQSSFIQKYYNG